MVTKAICILLAFAASAAAAVRHVPPASVPAAAPLELIVEAPSTTPTMHVFYRPAGERDYTSIELALQTDSKWVAVVPAQNIIAPAIEYYLESGGAPVFASPELPHATLITSADSSVRRGRDLVRVAGKRSRVHTSAEFVDYGTRTVDNTRLVDRYYRIDADFAYRLWAYPLEELRIGYTRLIGDTESPMCTTSPCTAEAGFKVAGWFELGLAPVEGVRFDVRAAVMATQNGFAVGGRLEARLGSIDSSHVALGVEHLADVGTAGYFRLGWGTVPRLPMAATVEITDLPADDRPIGVRLYYDIAREVGGGVRIGARVGYAARTQTVAGFTGGGNVTVDF